mmetsp:Transcript_1561/g.4710  ORF Transcript_1561/g.4710 Transcript_1561/m.4710 type:complete len:235 (-) Transcript_1561:488-1192(-)
MLTAHAIERKAHLLQCRERGETRDSGADWLTQWRAQRGRVSREPRRPAESVRRSTPLQPVRARAVQDPTQDTDSRPARPRLRALRTGGGERAGAHAQPPLTLEARAAAGGGLDRVGGDAGGDKGEREGRDDAADDEGEGLLTLRVDFDQLLADGGASACRVAVEDAVDPRPGRTGVVDEGVVASAGALAPERREALERLEVGEGISASLSPLHDEAGVALLVAGGPLQLHLVLG